MSITSPIVPSNALHHATIVLQSYNANVVADAIHAMTSQLVLGLTLSSSSIHLARTSSRSVIKTRSFSPCDVTRRSDTTKGNIQSTYRLHDKSSGCLFVKPLDEPLLRYLLILCLAMGTLLLSFVRQLEEALGLNLDRLGRRIFLGANEPRQTCDCQYSSFGQEQAGAQ